MPGVRRASRISMNLIPPRNIEAIVSAAVLIAVLTLYLCRFARTRRWLVVALSACLADQAIKALLLRETFRPHVILFDGWISIEYLQNPGLGFGTAPTYLLGSTLTLAAALVVVYRFLAARPYRMSALVELGCALLIGGLLPIWLDRLRLGYSVDFLELGKGGDYAYNLADLSVFIGALLLPARVLQFLWRVRKRCIALTDPIDDDASVHRVADSAPAGPTARQRTRRGDCLRTLGLVTAAAIALVLMWHWGQNELERLPALHKAAARGDAATMERLLVGGADANARDEAGNTPLTHAARDPKLVQLLLAHGADPNLQGQYGLTPLDRATWGRDVRAVRAAELLLAHGARLTASHRSTRSILCGSIAARNPKMVSLLLAKGAQVNAREPAGGKTPLIWAAQMGADRTGGDIAKLLLAAGASVNARDRDGRTALHFACERGDMRLVKTLLAAGADVNAADREGATPLILASGSAIGALAGRETQGATPMCEKRRWRSWRQGPM